MAVKLSIFFDGVTGTQPTTITMLLIFLQGGPKNSAHFLYALWPGMLVIIFEAYSLKSPCFLSIFVEIRNQSAIGRMLVLKQLKQFQAL